MFLGRANWEKITIVYVNMSAHVEGDEELQEKQALVPNLGGMVLLHFLLTATLKCGSTCQERMQKQKRVCECPSRPRAVQAGSVFLLY